MLDSVQRYIRWCQVSKEYIWPVPKDHVQLLQKQDAARAPNLPLDSDLLVQHKERPDLIWTRRASDRVRQVRSRTLLESSGRVRRDIRLCIHLQPLDRPADVAKLLIRSDHQPFDRQHQREEDSRNRAGRDWPVGSERRAWVGRHKFLNHLWTKECVQEDHWAHREANFLAETNWRARLPISEEQELAAP